MSKQKETEWQSCTEGEISMFEDYFEEGAFEIRLLGTSKRLKDAYKDYYQWRINCEDGSVEILEDDY